ncbi:MAG: peptidoglycan binding protein CsiV [Halieaceae bacterium]|uniref:CsiV family protein n=1 Tax=Haliea alexandrii TaxID=2448162 RepID=UPI000F0B4287|nr:CsiV family protein [Haliea alexandrii]MCR9184546.1 peptidoglycan binding protein CsiV [Halieaceae bacterium]
MIPHPIHTLLTFLAAALAFPLAPAQAQEREQNWYQVELLVVAHTNPTAQRAEQWEPLPRLAYPEAFRFLLDPQRLRANLERTPDASHSEVDANGKQLIHLRRRSSPAALDDTAPPPTTAEASGSALDAVSDGPGRSPEDSPASGDPAAVTEAPNEARLPTAFLTLPAQAREFRGKAAYMERNGPYRVLFHEVWWQPVGGARSALPIVLDQSGDQQSYPALQGTVRLHRSRFLHVDTQLWLNTSGDYLPGTWRMPPPPLGPVSLERVPAALLPDADADVLSAVTGYDPAWDAAPGLLEEATPTAAPVYPYRHAVLLQQQRRMRSNEVHYIDHPLMGVVIKLTPLDAEALHAAAYDRDVLELITGPQTPTAAVADPAGA